MESSTRWLVMFSDCLHSASVSTTDFTLHFHLITETSFLHLGASVPVTGWQVSLRDQVRSHETE